MDTPSVRHAWNSGYFRFYNVDGDGLVGKVHLRNIKCCLQACLADEFKRRVGRQQYLALMAKVATAIEYIRLRCCGCRLQHYEIKLSGVVCLGLPECAYEGDVGVESCRKRAVHHNGSGSPCPVAAMKKYLADIEGIAICEDVVVYGGIVSFVIVRLIGSDGLGPPARHRLAPCLVGGAGIEGIAYVISQPVIRIMHGYVLCGIERGADGSLSACIWGLERINKSEGHNVSLPEQVTNLANVLPALFTCFDAGIF